MSTTCDSCGADAVTFRVPAALREHAPEDAAVAAVCTECLDVAAAPSADADAEPDVDPDAEADAEPSPFRRVDEAFPSGRGGVAFALLLGALPSLALRKQSVRALRDEAERAGVDVSLTLRRLAESSSVTPAFDVDRRRRQFESLLEQ
ncbi:DUF6276 family protein [Halobaculum sp. D14]|uniref:DUF6276 family protein n=1 Tax=Halobaculum sp. D14 TaxID=3421642 RepID=UPI003EBC5D39